MGALRIVRRPIGGRGITGSRPWHRPLPTVRVPWDGEHASLHHQRLLALLQHSPTTA